jgi:hypothetical protein
MSSQFEPDAKFVDRLEWQLASEFRRREHLKPAPGRVNVPRPVFVLGLAAGVLLLGVAATKAADIIKDSWRKKIEVARLETEVKIKTAFLEFKKEWSAQMENKRALGIISNEETLTSKSSSQEAAAELDRAILDLEEAKASGEAPRNELYAPLVEGRDFVSERLEIERKSYQLEIELRRDRIEPALRHRVDLGLIPKSDLDDVLAWLSVEEAGIKDIKNRLALRRRFLSGEISAGELEIQTRMSAAEKDLREARSEIDTVSKVLDDLRAKEAVGMVANSPVKAAQLAMDAAQAKADLAAREIEILKQLK